jgi:hypothetical protein
MPQRDRGHGRQHARSKPEPRRDRGRGDADAVEISRAAPQGSRVLEGTRVAGQLNRGSRHNPLHPVKRVQRRYKKAPAPVSGNRRRRREQRAPSLTRLSQSLTFHYLFTRACSGSFLVPKSTVEPTVALKDVKLRCTGSLTRGRLGIRSDILSDVLLFVCVAVFIVGLVLASASLLATN